MARLAVYKYLALLVLVLTVLVMVFTFCGLVGGFFQPSNTALAMMVYVLPLLLIANLVLLAYWLIRRKWLWAIMPTLALACSVHYVGTFYQVDFLGPNTTNKSGLVLATYNVARFNNELSGFRAQDILAEMRRQQVDVFCIQEYKAKSGDHDNTSSYVEYFPYVAKGKDDMVIFSRFPILKTKTISFGGDTNNSAQWAELNVRGKRLRIINVHLQTTGISRTLHKAAKADYQGALVENNSVLRLIYGNYTQGMVIRGRQADMIAAERDDSKLPCVICGDFNDVPYSYVYRTVKGPLVDGFQECGKGYMYTYRGNKQTRIDYIFHDERLKGQTYYKQNLTYSDHLPVFMKVQL